LRCDFAFSHAQVFPDYQDHFEEGHGGYTPSREEIYPRGCIYDVRTLRTQVTLCGQEIELVTHRGGPLEVYREYEEQPGLYRFLGYYDALCVEKGLRGFIEKLHPVVIRHLDMVRDTRERAGLLRGAETW